MLRRWNILPEFCQGLCVNEDPVVKGRYFVFSIFALPFSPQPIIRVPFSVFHSSISFVSLDLFLQKTHQELVKVGCLLQSNLARERKKFVMNAKRKWSVGSCNVASLMVRPEKRLPTLHDYYKGTWHAKLNDLLLRCNVVSMVCI